jgi:hypothetical protein
MGDWLTVLTQDFGLVAFTAVAVLLLAYLAYSMAHPEKF